MATSISDRRLKNLVQTGRFDELFEDLLWDNPDGLRSTSIPLPRKGDDAGIETWTLEPVVQKRGVAVFTCAAPGRFPDRETRRRIARELQRTAHEHLIVFHSADFRQQVWYWPYREPGKPARPREIEFNVDQNAAALKNLLSNIQFDFANEGTLTLTDVTAAINRAASPDRVVKRFYDEFSRHKTAFQTFIDGLPIEDERDYYAALMLNRLMFTWFLQAKGFLDNDRDYLRNRLDRIERGDIPGLTFHQFYKGFLRTLFHDGFDNPERNATIRAQLGDIPYINGGIFAPHRLEENHPGIDIPNAAFRTLFDFFGEWNWQLDDRPLGSANEINPDVLGHIFEKYVNQKEKGAYYTKEDVTGYISQNTILPWLLDTVREGCRVAFDTGQPGNAWELLKDAPDRYIYRSMRHGVLDDIGNVFEMPELLVAGEHDIAQRGNWNQRATAPYALPTETWREYFHRRKRMLELRQRLASGEIHAVDDLITWNLDIRQFAQDVVAHIGGVDLIRAFWKAVRDITILDPTVGSGAFLFAAVKVIEPLSLGLMERMREEVERASARALPDLRGVLDEADKHPNLEYFVLRQIILNNLYGVDIEEEAVEICKLRLFLLLAARLQPGKQVEPLPDIDFNIRAGNTLVGYATENEVKRAAGGGQLALVPGDPFAPIDEAVLLADQAFQQFKLSQGDDEAARADLPNAKAGYLARITGLRKTLDHYLFDQQRPTDGFDAWRARTQPFHWFAEFHSIVIGNRGFDVIIGNPPYVRASEVRRQYELNGFKTERCPDIYAMVLERVADLLEPAGRSGMIVPLSLSFSGDFDALRKVLAQQYKNSWFSSFARIPSALFSHDVRVRNTIHLGHKGRRGTKALSTRIHRWSEVARVSLFSTLDYASFSWGAFNWMVPRFNRGAMITRLVELDSDRQNALEHRVARGATNYPIYFAPTAYNWITFTPSLPPSFGTDGLPLSTNDAKTIYAVSDANRKLLSLTLSGIMGFVYWSGLGDDFHVTKGQMTAFPLPPRVPDETARDALHAIFDEFVEALPAVTNFKLNAGKRIGRYDIIKLRHITDRSDAIFKDWLGLTDEMWEEVLLHNAQMVKTDFAVDEPA